MDIITQYLGTHAAGEDLSGFQYRAVRYNMFQVWQLGDAVNGGQGILVNKPTTTQAAKVAVQGVITARVSGPVTAGRRLSVGANGELFEDSTGTFGWALDTAAGAGLISVYVLGMNITAGGGGGSPVDITIPTYLAGAAVNTLSVVRMRPSDTRLLMANSATPDDSDSVLGVSLSAVTTGQAVQVRNQGRIQDAGFAWDDGINPTIFLNGNGVLSQTPPITGFVQQMGFVVNTTTMHVQIDQPIRLAA